MAWTDPVSPAQGTATKKSLIDIIIADLVHLFNLSGGGGSSVSSGSVNGSFEIDSDADGVPDGWTMTYYTGGSGAIDEVNPLHGAKSWKFTHPGGAGNGGGYADLDDYVVCAEGLPLCVEMMLLCSAAGIHVSAHLLWYDKAKSYLSTTDVYDESTSNPTSSARLVFLAVPPSTARFCKFRVIGGKNDVDVSGTVTIDAISIYAGNSGIIRATYAEDSSASESWTDEDTATLILPAVSSNGHIRLTFWAESRGSSGGQRFTVGGYYSGSILAGSAVAYGKGLHQIDLFGASGGAVVMTHQLTIGTDGTGTTYGRKLNPEIFVEVLHA